MAKTRSETHTQPQTCSKATKTAPKKSGAAAKGAKAPQQGPQEDQQLQEGRRTHGRGVVPAPEPMRKKATPKTTGTKKKGNPVDVPTDDGADDDISTGGSASAVVEPAPAKVSSISLDLIYLC